MLLRSSAINLIFKVLGLFLGLAITVITARLGTFERGSYSIFTLIAQVFITIFSGFCSAIAYRISRHDEQPGPLVSATLGFAVISGGVFSVVLLAISWLFPSPPYDNLWIMAIAAPALLIVPYVNGVYLGQGDMRRLNINAASASLLCLLFIGGTGWQRSSLSLHNVLFAWSASQIGAATLSIFLLARNVPVTLQPVSHLKQMIPFARQIGGTGLVSLLNYRADLLLVQMILGLSATGVYSVVVAIAEMLWFVSSSVTMAAYSRIGSQSDAESAAFVLRIVHLNILLLLLVSPLLFLSAYWAVPLFFGESYREGVIPLLILLPGVLLYGAASTISAFFTNRLGRPELCQRIALLSLIINVALSLVALPLMGISGGALASSVAYAGSIVFSLHQFSKHSGVSWRTILTPDRECLRNDLFKLCRISSFRAAR